MIFGLAVIGVTAYIIAEQLEKKARVFPQELDGHIKEGADQLLRDIKTNLSGVPGMPQPETRAYQNSWRQMQFRTGHRIVYSNSEYGMRLEHGFHGTDSLGRNVSQHARPHIAPAVAKFRKDFPEEIRKAVQQEWRA